MAGRILSTALIGALVAASFHFFGDVEAEPKARLAVLNAPVETEISMN